VSTQRTRPFVLLLLVSALLWILLACRGQSESAAPPATEPPAPTPAETPAKTESSSGSRPEAIEAAVEAESAETDNSAASGEVTEAATVRQLAQLLDLRQVALPEGTEAPGQADVGQLLYQTPAEVTAVVDFYRPLLTEQGWQEQSDQSYVDTATATLYFTKEGYALSLTASQSGDGSTMVTLMHHGNIDLRTLPQMADAEEGFAAPNTLIYFSPSGVAEVAGFTRQELTAQGWHEYTRPNTSSADNADTQTLSFIQNGLELSSFISLAPAQDNKTSVQYSLIPLALDLPIPDDATKVEFDASQPYLGFQSPASPDTLVEFYRTEMTALGWTEVEDRAMINPDQASLTFDNEAEQMALTLSLATGDDGATVVLQPFDADLLTETEETGPTEEVSETTDTETAGAMPDLPFPEDAQDVVYDADATQITFTSPSKVTEVAEFYREALPEQGWQEDADFSIVEDTFGSLEFSQGNENLSITLFPDVINGDGTQVMIDVSGMVAPVEEVAEMPFEESTPAADTPGYTINDWPFPPEAIMVNRSGDKLTYSVAQDLQTIADFYRPTFELMELGTSCLDDIGDYTSISCSSSNGDYSLNFFAFEAGDNNTEVEINFTNYALGSADSGDSSTGPLTAEDKDGLPVPSDYTNYLSEGSPFLRKVTFTSPSDSETLVQFYQAELPPLGWEQAGEVSSSGDTTSLTFEGAEGKLTVTIKPSGGESEVVLASKNPTAAAEAGILPPAGQARIYMVNFSTEELTVTINDQVIKIAPEAGTTSPDDAPKLDLKPGSYKVTTKAGSSSVTDEVTIGADEVWSLLLNPEGAAPLQMY
jgi:hypothetical protein